MNRPFIHFLPHDKSCPVQGASSVLEVALKGGVEIAHSCGGMGSCTTCRVIVVSAEEALPPRTELEQEMADSRGFHDNERLACQLTPVKGLVVSVPLSEPDEI